MAALIEDRVQLVTGSDQADRTVIDPHRDGGLAPQRTVRVVGDDVYVSAPADVAR